MIEAIGHPNAATPPSLFLAGCLRRAKLNAGKLSGVEVPNSAARKCPVLAHRDLASRIHVGNAAESGQAPTDANDPERTNGTVAQPSNQRPGRSVPLSLNGLRCGVVRRQWPGAR